MDWSRLQLAASLRRHCSLSGSKAGAQGMVQSGGFNPLEDSHRVGPVWLLLDRDCSHWVACETQIWRGASLFLAGQVTRCAARPSSPPQPALTSPPPGPRTEQARERELPFPTRWKRLVLGHPQVCSAPGCTPVPAASPPCPPFLCVSSAHPPSPSDPRHREQRLHGSRAGPWFR